MGRLVLLCVLLVGCRRDERWELVCRVGDRETYRSDPEYQWTAPLARSRAWEAMGSGALYQASPNESCHTERAVLVEDAR